MSDIKRKLKNKKNEAENKAHELKGRLDQKQKDMKKDN